MFVCVVLAALAGITAAVAHDGSTRVVSRPMATLAVALLVAAALAPASTASAVELTTALVVMGVAFAATTVPVPDHH